MFINTKTSKTNFQSISAGTAIILLHGWGCDWQIWSKQINELSKQFKLIIPDLPAFGQSYILNLKTWDSFDYAVWLDEFIKEVLKKDEQFILVGHSFGGKIAAIYASTYRDKNLKLLVLVDASGLPNRQNLAQVTTSIIVQIIPDVLKNIFGSTFKSKILSSLGASTDSLFSTKLQKKILKKVVHENILIWIKKVGVNTLVMWGKNDQDTPLVQGEEMKRNIKQSELIIFKEAGHFPFIDSANDFNKILAEKINSTK